MNIVFAPQITITLVGGWKPAIALTILILKLVGFL